MTAPTAGVPASLTDILSCVSAGLLNNALQAQGFNNTDITTQSITGTTEQEQIDSIVTALVNLGFATDDRG